MAKGKGKKSKGKGRGRKRKGKRSSAKHSAALEGTGAWGLYEVATSDLNGQTVVERVIRAPFDKAQRVALKGAVDSGQLKGILLNKTKPLQMVAMVKVAQKVPIVKGPVNMIVSAANKLGRELGIKGRWKLV